MDGMVQGVRVLFVGIWNSVYGWAYRISSPTVYADGVPQP